MVIAIASGKGGTGKTTVATNLTLSLTNSVYLDCDVEEPNGHLFLNPDIHKTKPVSRKLPTINFDKCTYCGICAKTCEFHAIAVLPDQVLIFDELCHSCGACIYFCPENVMKEKNKIIGVLREGVIFPEKIPFIEGCLNIGEMMATPLIKAVKGKCLPDRINILDAPPGTSCSMVETVRDADYCILVTEPTPFGRYDLELSVEVLRYLNVPFGIIINKYRGISGMIEEYAMHEEIPILLKLEDDRRLAEAYSRGEPAVKRFPDLKGQLRDVYATIIKNLKNTKTAFLKNTVY